MHVLRGLAFLGLLVCSSPAAASPSGVAGAVQADVRPLYQLMLEWAVLAKPLPGGVGQVVFPDRYLIKDTSLIRVSSENLPPGLRLTLPSRQIQILPEKKLKQIAAEAGKFPALFFSKVKTFEAFAELGVELRWYLGKPSRTVPLSGGGVRIRFRWKGGTWKFEKRLGMWIS